MEPPRHNVERNKKKNHEYKGEEAGIDESNNASQNESRYYLKDEANTLACCLHVVWC